ncbi:MAG: thymidylate synthase, partial [Candidatus Bathyarchaeota archaeon]|nr:thymidylate synthase [Candidatus Termiticorpusculum sp.]
NIAGLQLFNEAFVDEINKKGNLNLKPGKLIFHSKNCHIYQRQYNLIKELLEPKDNNTKRLAKTITDKKDA